MTQFKTGDAVEILHRGKHTGVRAVVRSVVKSDCGTYLVASVVGEGEDAFPVYDREESFVGVKDNI